MSELNFRVDLGRTLGAPNFGNKKRYKNVNILKTKILRTVTATTITTQRLNEIKLFVNQRGNDTMTVDANVHLPLFQIVVAATPDGGIGRGMHRVAIENTNEFCSL